MQGRGGVDEDVQPEDDEGGEDEEEEEGEGQGQKKGAGEKVDGEGGGFQGDTSLADIRSIDKAVFAICKVDVLNPPIPIMHGQFNTREIDKRAVGALLTEFKKEAQRHMSATAIPVLAKRGDLVASCHYLHAAVSDAPWVELTEEGKGREHFLGVGGNHRTAALRMWADELKVERDKLQSRLEKMEGKVKVKVKGKAAEKSVNTEIELKTSIAKIEQELSEVGYWTVYFYDEGK